jgi:formylglycine-generating enzyme required for sulfatase activity
VGINIPAQASYPTRVVAGHEMVDLPGGWFVMGSSVFEDAPPRWVGLDRYSIATTTTSEGQHCETRRKSEIQEAPINHPVTMVSYDDALHYVAMRSGELTLPTAAQWESVARGPAVKMQEVMEEETGRFTPQDFIDFAEGRFENFVFGPGGQIFANPAENQLFQSMVERGRPFFGWRVYGTPSGRLTPDEAWYEQEGTAPVDWGPPNAYGLKGMTGGVGEWVKGWHAREVNMLDVWNPTGPVEGEYRAIRGASWSHYDPHMLRAAYNTYGPLGFRANNVGFRVGAPQGS